MYEVYRKQDDGSEVTITYATKAQATIDAVRINEIGGGGWKVRRVKTDYIYVVNRDGKYLTTVKTRKRARSMVKWYNKLGIKCTITQIDLNKAGGKTVR
ncbi:hypothetical protein [Pseudomonas phage K4]|uniref:hypothetical protein n=1 Tax=Pseudomonas phage O4 TaxID=1784982 RepID=UPI00078DB2E5|nr:hypothetical protein BJD45_gp49 [Pseudomonas phage O4]AMO43524.1 hypothetical protein O4_49 [Pseudomonas phage O4]ATG86284.1 hypothetical protein [Pseudomonas phage IME180]QWS70025.1 hypothetical protein [Pseudomonas phage K4]